MQLKNLVIGIVTIGIACIANFAGALPSSAAGTVYTATNDPNGNEIVVFSRSETGQLTRQGNVHTGGRGSGGQLDPLGSQGSLKLTSDSKWLLAVNAGSSEISVFKILGNNLKLLQKVSSGGNMPVSLAVYGNLVYVLNGGATPNIVGFNLNPDGSLSLLEGSVRAFTGVAANALAQVDFDVRKRSLVITDEADNTLIIYPVDDRGLPAPNAAITAAAGVAPFGFISDPFGRLFVVNAGSGTVASYLLNHAGGTRSLGSSAGNDQKASCWIGRTDQGYVYTTNPGSSTISLFYSDWFNGSISLTEKVAATAKTPLDFAIVDNQFLYAVDPAAGGVDFFKIGGGGKLRNVGVAAGNLAVFAQGLAAY